MEEFLFWTQKFYIHESTKSAGQPNKMQEHCPMVLISPHAKLNSLPLISSIDIYSASAIYQKKFTYFVFTILF